MAFQNMQGMFPAPPAPGAPQLPTPPQNPVGPPQTPEDEAARVQGWDAILQNLQNPGIASALFQFGTQMLQPRDTTQSATGFAANALQNTLAQQRAMQVYEEQRKAAAAKQALDERRVAADEGRVKVAERQVGVQEAASKREAAMTDLDKQLKQAEINYKNAAAKRQQQGEGADVAHLNTIADALWAESQAGRGEEFPSRDAALLRAQEILKMATGGREKFLSDYLVAKSEFADPEDIPAIQKEAETLANYIFGSKGKTAAGTTGEQITTESGMPDPAKYKGRVIKDNETGDVYKSNGKTWERQ